MRLARAAYKKKFGVGLEPQFTYEMFDDHADLEIVTGLESFIDKKRLLKNLKDFEKIPNLDIHVEEIKDE